VCPAGNITVTDKVVYGDNCYNCLACVHACPQTAINVKLEKSTDRWRNPQVSLKEIIDANRQVKQAPEQTRTRGSCSQQHETSRSSKRNRLRHKQQARRWPLLPSSRLQYRLFGRPRRSCAVSERFRRCLEGFRS
jgi:Fe-S-cluster-containing hydrogenase component 2